MCFQEAHTFCIGIYDLQSGDFQEHGVSFTFEKKNGGRTTAPSLSIVSQLPKPPHMAGHVWMHVRLFCSNYAHKPTNLGGNDVLDPCLLIERLCTIEVT